MIAGEYQYKLIRRIWSGWKLWIETKGKRGIKPPRI